MITYQVTLLVIVTKPVGAVLMLLCWTPRLMPGSLLVLSSGGVPGFGARCSLPVVVGSTLSLSVTGVAVEPRVCVGANALPGGTVVIVVEVDTMPCNISSLIMMLISCTLGVAGDKERTERKRNPANIDVYQAVVRKKTKARIHGMSMRFCGKRRRRGREEE